MNDVGKLVSRGWKLRRPLMACWLVICMMLSLLTPSLLSVQQASAAEPDWTIELPTDGIHTANPVVPENASTASYRDVQPTDWFYDAVGYVQSLGIFNGTGEGTFSPYGSMTRAMYVTALGRMAGVDISKYSGYTASTFSDVPLGAWYAPYVEWAAEAGITSGTGNGKFSPDAVVSREQMATLLVRFFDVYEFPLPEAQAAETMPADLDRISPWAADAVVKLWQAGLLIGDANGNFNPNKEASRAEAAVTLMRSSKVVVTWQEQKPESGETDPGSGGDTEDPVTDDEDDKDEGAGDNGNSGGIISPAYYSVTFESNGGSSVPGQSVRSGSKAAEPESPAKDGYTFAGWFVDRDLTEAYIFSSAVYGHITLYAKWTHNIFTVSFDTNGGSRVDSQSVAHGNSVSSPDAPTRTGYTFDGWYSDSIWTTRYDFNTAVTSNVTLYAKWTVNAYTVSFNSNGGSAVSSKSVNFGDTVQQPDAPTRTKHAFDGWYTDSEWTNAYDFTAPVTEDLTLYAKWVEQFTVIFESNGGTAFAMRTVLDGRTIDSLPVPTKDGYLFQGWFKDSEFTRAFSENSPVTADMTVYAKYMEHIIQTAKYTPINSVMDVDQNFTITVLDKSREMSETEVLASIAFEDVANPEGPGIAVTGGDGRFTVASAAEGRKFEEGNTYELTLEDDSLIFEGQDETTRVYVFSVAKDEALTIPLNPDMIYLPFSEVENMTLDGEELGSPAIPVISTTAGGSEDELGAYLGEANAGRGTFTYAGSEVLQVGDVVAIYEGVKPIERSVDTDGPGAGDIAYVEIAQKDGTTYTYRAANSKQVLFKPDILPVHAAADQDGDDQNHSIKIERQAMDYSDSLYAPFGLSELTTIDVQDFIGFYEGTFGTADMEIVGYGRITSVTYAAEWIYMDYEEVTIDDIEHAFNIYASYEIESDLLITDDEIAILESQIKEQAIASGFVDRAVDYLTGLAMETKTVKSYDVSIAALNKISIRNLTVVPSINGSPRYIPGLQYGVSATLRVGVDVVINLNDESSLVIHLSGTFLQEIGVSVNVDGDLKGHWHTATFPFVGEVPLWYVIDDYVVTANLDAHTYTGVNIEAEIATVERSKLEELLWDWGNSRNTAIILNIASEVQALLEGAEYNEIDAQHLKAKYKELLENDTDWVTLIKKKLIEKSFRVAFGAVEVKFEAEFVVKANINIALGIDFNYKTAKRYSVTLYVWDAWGYKNTVELPGNGDYQLTFYVMGTMGLRAGVHMELKAGVGSVKLNSIGLAAEPGAYLQMWGYFYYQLIKQNSQEFSRAAGALLLELGMYLDTAISAQLGDGFLSGSVPIYEETWPLLSVGSDQIVDDFAYTKEETPKFNLAGKVTSLAVPNSLFNMSTFTLKSGIMGSEVYDLSHFDISVDNPNFRFNPATRTLEVVDPNLTVAEGNLVITWKGTPLTFSYEPIKRTIPLLWLSREGDYILQLDPQNGNMTQVSSLAYKAPINVATPERPGYTFLGWYTQPTGGTEEEIPASMPARDITLYAHWMANTNTPYTVEHYWVNPNSRAEPTLVYSETRTGTTDTEIRFTSNIYNEYGYTSGSVSGMTIKGDGSTVVRVEYFPTNRTMTFNWGYDGAPSSNITDQFGKNIANRIPQPTRPGYIFTGWTPEVPSTVPAVDTAYVATWEAREDTPYQVVYLHQMINSNSYAVVDTEMVRGTTDQLARVTADMERAYEGFVLDKNVPGTVLEAGITGDGSTLLKLYYKRQDYKLTIHYEHPDMNDREVNLPYGATIGLQLGEPARTGYTFTGWLPVPPGTMPARDLEVTAQWEINTYTVNFETGGGTSIPAQTVQFGIKATEPDVPEKSGYAFAGWFTDTGYTKPYDFDALVTGNLTLYAKWLVRYTVSFETGEGSPVDDVKVNEGGRLTPPDQPEWEGYVFSGWYLDEEFTTPYDFETAVTGNLTLYAKWTEEVKTTYMINFVTGGGSVVQDLEVIEGAVAQKPADPSRDGYTFEGWYRDSSFTTLYNFNDVVMDHITLYAKWEAIRYTVSFNSMGGTDVPDVTVVYGNKLVAPASPTRTGYRFVGWYTDVSVTNVYDYNQVVEGNFTLYAKWIAVYTVTFDSDGGSEVPAKTVDIGEAVEVPTAPTKSGYVFDGWYTADDQAYNFATPVTGNITLYAKWTQNVLTVTFISNGSVVATQTVDTTSDDWNAGRATIVKLPNWPGYQFDGWYTDTTWSAKYDFTQEVTASLTLYAKWTSTSWIHVGEILQDTVGLHSDIVYDSTGTPYIAYFTYEYENYEYVGSPGYLKKYVNGAWQDVGMPEDLELLDTRFTNLYTLLAFDSMDNLYWVLYGLEDLAVYKLAAGTSTWEHIGDLGFDDSYEYPTSIAVDSNDHLYVAYTASQTYTIVIEKYNGSTWETVSERGEFPDSSEIPIIGFGQDDVLYMLYRPYDGGYYRRVAKLVDGQWQDITDANLLNVSDAVMAIGPDKLPYVVYRTGNQMAVIKYRNGIWEPVGDTSFVSLRDDYSSYMTIDFDQYGAIYVSYQDHALEDKVSVIKYEAEWSILGNAGLSTGAVQFHGISIDPGGNAYVYYIDHTFKPIEAIMGDSEGELIIRKYTP